MSLDHLWIICTFAVMVNMVFGAAVWVAIDVDGRLYEWYEACPPPLDMVAQPLILTLWPVGLVLFVWSKLCRSQS